MSAKHIFHGTGARSKLVEGAKTAARAISVTYGPKGRNCVLDRMAGMMITKDGVTVAREVELKDPLANMGAATVREACIRVNNEVGDGTTTTAILTHSLLVEGAKLLEADVVAPTVLARQMMEATDRVITIIESISNNLETEDEIRIVADLSSNGDTEIAEKLAEACMSVGKDGTVIIEDGSGLEVTIEYKDGMELTTVVRSEILGTGIEREIQNPLIAVVNKSLVNEADVGSMMACAISMQRSLVLYAVSIDAVAADMFWLNDREAESQFDGCAVPAPGMIHRKEDYLGDIAALCGAKMVDPRVGDNHQDWDPEWFGSAERVHFTLRSSTIFSNFSNKERIETRIKEIKNQEKSAGSEYDRDRSKERIAKLSGGLAILKVGGQTELAMKERRARIEDALGAIKTALHSGVVPGGGLSFLIGRRHMAAMTDDLNYGEQVVFAALSSPTKKLAENAGWSPDVVVRDIEDQEEMEICFDAKTETMRDCRDYPMIVDPTGVVVESLRTSVSIASTLLTTEVAITRAA